MKQVIFNFKHTLLIAVAGLCLASCQKKDRPELNEYPVDANPPGGPLKFFAAFDGTSSSSTMNAVDSIRANFPGDNPLASIDGVKGKAVMGEAKKFVKYGNPNDWISTAKSYTIAFWEKHDGATKNNTGTNGPEFAIALRTGDDESTYWAQGSQFLLFEGTNDACALKLYTMDKAKKDAWLVWEGAKSIAGLMDNQWHHLAFVYEETGSTLTLYVDGVANPNVAKWEVEKSPGVFGPHGAPNVDAAAVTEFRIGGGPKNGVNTDDWTSSTWKGGIDQFRMYGAALSAADVAALFTNKE